MSKANITKNNISHSENSTTSTTTTAIISNDSKYFYSKIS